MGKSLLDLNMRELSFKEAKVHQSNGVVFKPASLYEPEHAPKGTQFVMVRSALGVSPFRIMKGKV